MQSAEIILLPNRNIGRIEGPLWGQFLEMVGRNVNGAIYDPQSPHARADGVRTDTLEALRALKPSYLRYPGGCAVAYLRWQDLVGPVAQRPRAFLYRPLQKAQSTAFGIPEAHAYCEELGCELYLVVNANTQSPEDAAHLVEYMNSDQPTEYADLRRRHGRKRPFGVRLFGLGNEIYGDWQPGCKTAAEYVAWCREAISQMKAVDPSIRTVVCGFGRPNPDWDRTVIKGLIEQMDYISMHNYFGRPVFRDCMAASRICEEMLQWVNLAIDEAMDHARRKDRPKIAFDEWNLWYRTTNTPPRLTDLERPCEEIYNYTDALTAASLLHVILRNARTIGLANISEAANVLGVLFTERDRCVRQTIYYPHLLLRDFDGARLVEAVVDAPVFSAKHERNFCGIIDPVKARDETNPTLLHYSDVSSLDVLACIDERGRKLKMSIVQKLEKQDLDVRLDLHGIAVRKGILIRELTGPGLNAMNTIRHPDTVGIRQRRAVFSGKLRIPRASHQVIEFDLA
jgi:alpha-N-arabinofuranosidase